MTEYLDYLFNWNDPDLVAAYDELPLWSALFGALMLQHVPLQPDRLILDLACGTGFPSLELAQRSGKTCRVVGLDPWLQALRRAQFKIRQFNIHNISLLDGNGAHLPFSDETYNMVVSNLGINNFDDPESILKECHRVLKPSGLVVITTNLYGHMQEFYEVYQTTLQEMDHSDWIDHLDDHVHHRVTIEKASLMLQEAGFAIERVIRDTFTMRFLDGSALLRHAFIKAGFLDGWRHVVSAESEQQVFARLERNLNRLAKQRGELVLTIPMAYIEGVKT